mgnify:CR=1 FL=1
MTEELEKLGILIDRLDSLTYSINMPLPIAIHIDGIRGSLPEIVEELKAVFKDLEDNAGNNQA